MKKCLLAGIFLFVFSVASFSQAKPSQSRNESIEWSHSWIIEKPDSSELPSILLIGDSHVERYFPVVNKNLDGKIIVSKITTSKSMGDPYLIKQLDVLIARAKFDIIFFNNGLHGVSYTPQEYAKYIPVVYKLLVRNNPKVKIVWINTTARRIAGDLENFDRYNDDVNKRNEFVDKFCKSKNISMLDFSSLSINNQNYYTNDGIHLNPEGVNAQAEMITDLALKLMSTSNADMGH